jgi:hypothetical protein
MDIYSRHPVAIGAPSILPAQNRLVKALGATIKYAEWPSGNIDYLVFMMKRDDSAAALTAGTICKIAVDPTSAATAAIMLADPATSNVDCNFYELYADETLFVPLQKPLTNDPQANGTNGAIALQLVKANGASIGTETARVWIGAAVGAK